MKDRVWGVPLRQWETWGTLATKGVIIQYTTPGCQRRKCDLKITLSVSFIASWNFEAILIKNSENISFFMHVVMKYKKFHGHTQDFYFS